jgi:chemotaxis protein histidine kinase CheA
MTADFSSLLAEMQADFIDELPERCNRLEERVLDLERGERASFDELYRQVHSLKGSGGTFGLPIITTICHQFESFIGERHERFDAKASTQALAFVDLLRKSCLPAARQPQGVAAIEQALEQLHAASLQGRASVLTVDASEAMRKFYQEVFNGKAVRLVLLDSGLAALACLLHEPFDLLVISRELPDLNGVAVLAALRESRCRNSDMAAIMVSSNPAPAPEHLHIRATVRRDPQLAATLLAHVNELLTQRREGR